jgi:acyl carrier protein
MFNHIDPAPTTAILNSPLGERTTKAARVRAIISTYVGEGLLPGVLDDAKLKELKVDALDRLGITCALDEEFLIEISDADQEGWKTVGDMVETVQRLGT